MASRASSIHHLAAVQAPLVHRIRHVSRAVHIREAESPLASLTVTQEVEYRELRFGLECPTVIALATMATTINFHDPPRASTQTQCSQYLRKVAQGLKQ